LRPSATVQPFAESCAHGRFVDQCEATAQDLALCPEAELAARGLRRLPTSLAQALDAFEADAVARSWWQPQLIEVYLKHKRGEVALLEGLSNEEQAERYAEVY